MKAILHKTLLSIIILFLFESCSKNKDIVIEHAAMMFKHYQSIEKIKEIDYVVFSSIFDTTNKYKKTVIANIDKGLLDSGNWYNWNAKNDMNYLFLFCPNDNLPYYVKWNV